MRPMWSITTGTGERLSAGVSSPIRSAAMWICRCQPISASRLANAITVVDRRALAEMLHVVEARAAEALRVEPLELGVGDVDRHQRHAADRRRLWRRSRRRWRHCRSRGGAVHDHAVLDAEKLVQREQHLLRRVGRRVARRRRESARAARTRAHARRRRRRQLQFRLAGRRHPGRRDGGRVGGVRVMWRFLHEVGRAGALEGRLVSRRKPQARRRAADDACRHSTGLRQSR